MAVEKSDFSFFFTSRQSNYHSPNTLDKTHSTWLNITTNHCIAAATITKLYKLHFTCRNPKKRIPQTPHTFVLIVYSLLSNEISIQFITLTLPHSLSIVNLAFVLQRDRLVELGLIHLDRALHIHIELGLH